MANEGKRCYCRCIKEMTMIIGKEEEIKLESIVRTRKEKEINQVTLKSMIIKYMGKNLL